MMSLTLPPLPDEEVDQRLAEMERLGSRDYKEIGVPMFLVAEDLSGGAGPRPAPDGSGRLLAMLLAEGAEALRRRRPDLGAEDIAQLIEQIADRHFLSLALPAFSRDSDLHPEETAWSRDPQLHPDDSARSRDPGLRSDAGAPSRDPLLRSKDGA